MFKILVNTSGYFDKNINEMKMIQNSLKYLKKTLKNDKK